MKKAKRFLLLLIAVGALVVLYLLFWPVQICTAGVEPSRGTAFDRTVPAELAFGDR